MKIKSVSITEKQIKAIQEMANEAGLNFSDMLRRLIDEILKIKKLEK